MAEPFPFAHYFGEINVLAALQFMPGDKPYADRPAGAATPKDLLLYLGCNVLRTAHLAKTAIAVLRAMGFDFNAAGGPAYCCGVIHYLNGQTASGLAYAGRSLGHFERFGPKKVIMWCPSCHEQYDDVVSREHTIPFPYEHMTSFVARHLDRVRFVRRVEKTVALHYHTGHPQQDDDWHSTRAILEAIPGLRYVEIPNPPALGRHCSSRYIGRLGRPAWQRHVDDVMAAAGRAGVDVLATIYHSCHREMCHEEARRPFAVVNYISLLGEAMGIEHPDVYKRFRLMEDPDAVFEAVRPYVEAQGLDPARVREVIAKSFAPACAPAAPPPVARGTDSPAMQRPIRVETMAPPLGGDSDAVAAGDTVYVSGQASVDAQGRLVGRGNVVAQARQTLENLRRVLGAAGATLDDVVKLTIYLTNRDEREKVNEVRKEFFGRHKPASTLIEVARLGVEGLLIEIDAVAVIRRNRA